MKHTRYLVVTAAMATLAAGSVEAATTQQHSGPDPEWARPVLASQAQFLNALHADVDGNIYITGYLAGVLELDGVSLEGSGAGDPFPVKLDPAGRALWGRRGSGPGWSGGWAIVEGLARGLQLGVPRRGTTQGLVAREASGLRTTTQDGDILCATAAAECPSPKVARPDRAGFAALQEGTGWRVLELDLDVTVRPDSGYIRASGTAELQLEAETSRGPVLTLSRQSAIMRMDLLEVAAESEGAGEPEVTLNVPHPDDQGVLMQVARFARPLTRGDRVTARFDYRSVGQASQFVVRPDIAYASWTAAWYPLPLASGTSGLDSAGRKAPGATRLRLPPGWRALASGQPGTARGSNEDAGALEWRNAVGASRSFVAGPYSEAAEASSGDVRVQVLLLAPKPMGADKQAEQLAEAIEILEGHFGPYPFSPLAIAELPDGLEITAASEPNFIVASARQFLAPDGNLALFAHEASHAWWGNSVSAGGAGAVFLSESMAQFGATLAIEGIHGTDEARDFLEFSRPGYVLPQSARGYLSLVRMGFDAPLAGLTTEPVAHLLANSKGHWIYQMLRHRLGDEPFFGTLREILAEHRNGVVTIADLRGKFVENHPDQDLATFFHQWLDRGGLPVLDFEWHMVPKLGPVPWAEQPQEQLLLGEDKPPFEYQVSLSQLQLGEPYDLELELLVETLDGRTSLEAVHVEQRSHVFRLEAPAPLRRIELDPGRDVLMWRPAYGQPPVAGGRDQ